MYFEKQQKQVKTVTEITREIQHLLENQLRFVRIVGEVSNLRRPHSGHYYFSLKDQNSQIRAVLFKNQRRFLQKELREGQQILCDGRVTVYEPRGDYQLIVDTVDFQGLGQLQLRFEHLKNTLRNEGLFDTVRKKEIPKYIEKIVLITSPTGAAVHDFLTICRKRKASLTVQLLPVRVQGEGSAAEITRAIKLAHTLHPDAIVLCRGGGSIEDLWSFNEEIVARAICNAHIPIVTGVGHETDFTIADFCADIRGATPTAAAELLIPDSDAYGLRIDHSRRRMLRFINWRLESVTLRANRSSHFLSTYDSAFYNKTLRIDGASSRLVNIVSLLYERKKQNWAELDFRLKRHSPLHALAIHRNRLDYLTEKLSQFLFHQLEIKETALKRAAAVLDSVSPLATLARGYSIASRRSKDGSKEEIITDAEQVMEQDKITVRLHRGRLNCIVSSRSS